MIDLRMKGHGNNIMGVVAAFRNAADCCHYQALTNAVAEIAPGPLSRASGRSSLVFRPQWSKVSYNSGNALVIGSEDKVMITIPCKAAPFHLCTYASRCRWTILGLENTDGAGENVYGSGLC